MKQVILFLFLSVLSVGAFAAGNQSGEFANKLSGAFKNHMIVTKKQNYQELATIYGGEDIGHKSQLRVIA